MGPAAAPSGSLTPETGQHIADRLDPMRSPSQERIRTPARRSGGGPRHRRDVDSKTQSVFDRRKCATPEACLDHYDQRNLSSHQSIPSRELPRLHTGPRRTFGDQPAPLTQDAFGEAVVTTGAGLIDRRGQHREGVAAAVKRALVGRSIDSQSQARHNTEPFPSQAHAQIRSRAQALGRGPTRTDHRDTARAIGKRGSRPSDKKSRRRMAETQEAAGVRGVLDPQGLDRPRKVRAIDRTQRVGAFSGPSCGDGSIEFHGQPFAAVAPR